jgi:predicted DNA-binding transcriptional regulator YafY
MLSTLTVGGVLADGNDIKDQILLEEVPAGEEFLHTLFVAVRSGRRIVIGYQRFGGEAYEKEVSPLAIRLFHRRWYLLAFTGRHTATYSLDRMKSVRMTDHPLEQPEGFSPQQYFSEYFGVLTDETPLQHDVLRAWGRQADYLRTLPLHHSQHEIGSTEQYTDFAFDIRPTADFLAELLSHGNGIEVLEPAHVRQRMKEILSESLKKY